MGGPAIEHPLQARAGAGSTARSARLRLLDAPHSPLHDARRVACRTILPARLLTALLVVVLFAALVLAAGAALPAKATADAGDSIEATLRHAGLSGAGAGVYVWDLDTALPVYELNATTPQVPASNLKLVTTAAALMDWTAHHNFATELYVPDVPVSGGTLDGDVYLRGLGDPSLSTRAYQREELDFTTASFELLARALRREGVRRITGSVLGDASWFDRLGTVPYWKSGLQLECGPLSALSGNQGLDDGNRVKAPVTWASGLMTRALRGAGIKVMGKPGKGEVPSDAQLVKRQYSAPLPAILAHMNKESDNFFAEMLCKGLGKDAYGEGTTAAGAAASAAALHALGIAREDYVIQDGSGLSYGDRLSAESLVRVLGAMRQRDDFDAYYDSLAIAGVDGTLHERMRGTAAEDNARAKTGTLNVAVGLSGYVTSANGHLVAFSILLNGASMGTAGWSKATKAQDAIVVALAKATLPGESMLAATPVLRDVSLSALEPVHGVGGRLKPAVQPQLDGVGG